MDTNEIETQELDGAVAAAPPPPTDEDLARMIELPLLSPYIPEDEVSDGCRLALDLGVAAVVVRPCDVDVAVRILGHTAVSVGSVVGFPLGYSNTATKLYEGRDLLRRGAKELSFVVNAPKMLSRQFQYVETEILQMSESCRQERAVLKVAYESAYIAEDLKIILAKMLKRTETHFIETDALAEVAFLKRFLADRVKIKISGAVDTLDEALAAKDAGCERIGCMNAAEVLAAWKRRLAELAKPAAAES